MSIYHLRPLETGGVQSRQGLGFQDQVAAGFCLDMIIDDRLEEVWCETQDDITLLWRIKGQTKVEFVQVKGELGRLWSVARLCDREGKGIGHSIIEKSLAHDRCTEPTCFRIVTKRPVQAELRILTDPLHAFTLDAFREVLTADEFRSLIEGELTTLIDNVVQRVGGYISENGHGVEFWLRNATWDERHSDDAVKNANLIKLRRILEREGHFLAYDQIDDIYNQLVWRVWQAGMADYRTDPQGKRLRRGDVIAWLQRTASALQHPARRLGGKRVREKMEAAELLPDAIEAALIDRRFYRREVLKPKYLKVTDIGLVESKVTATLRELRSQLDSGLFRDLGGSFHSLCLEKLSELQGSIRSDVPPPLAFLHGCMYDIADRCLHRFTKART
jgi:hypothetical protein